MEPDSNDDLKLERVPESRTTGVWWKAAESSVCASSNAIHAISDCMMDRYAERLSSATFIDVVSGGRRCKDGGPDTYIIKSNGSHSAG
jgi:hypothetical protein